MNIPLLDPLGAGDLEDWGEKQNPIAGTPHQCGKICFGDESGPHEVGIWECTPGTWNSEIPNDEFCHLLSGQWRLKHESGEIMDLRAGDSVFLPKGWKGVSEVVSTVRKVYSITR